jgi:hypothetical protein
MNKINFASNHNYSNIFIAIIFNIFNPSRHTFKSLFPSHIKYNKSNGTRSIIRSGNSFKLLLSSSIPNL